jgi:hypothetical protein
VLLEDAMILSQDDAALFFRLMWRLQFYVSQHLQLLPDIKSPEAYQDVTSENKFLVRNALWKSPGLIDAYVQENPDGLLAEELSIIGKWKGFIAGKFYVFRYLKDHTIFISGSKVYQVLGLYERFEDVFHGQPLPILVEAVLLPFKGMIIYDGLCQRYNIHFGRGIRTSLNEEYMKAKQNGLIITTLEPETYPVRPAQHIRKPDEQSEAIVEEIIRASERLRGGTAIQSAAFGLLRASVKVVQAALQDPNELEDLQQLGRKVHNALNRLQTGLERAKY